MQCRMTRKVAVPKLLVLWAVIGTRVPPHAGLTQFCLAFDFLPFLLPVSSRPSRLAWSNACKMDENFSVSFPASTLCIWAIPQSRCKICGSVHCSTGKNKHQFPVFSHLFPIINLAQFLWKCGLSLQSNVTYYCNVKITGSKTYR